MGKTVLVIDDDPDIVNLLKLQLGQKGWDIQSASSAKEGMEKLQSGSFVALILDIQIPDQNGLELAEKILQEKKLPIVFVTGEGKKDHPIFQKEMVKFLEKPLNVDTLDKLLKEITS